MPEDDNAVYSTRQLADSLKLGTAMIRKYAVALESITGEEIPLKRRDGRQFSREHHAVISHAKALVDSNNGLNIETALRMALGTVEISSDALLAPATNRDSLEITQALTEAVARGNQELLAELRQLRQELLASRSFQNSTVRLPMEPVASSEAASEESLIIRSAKRLDNFLKRFLRS
jgi:hypothetical protein